MTPVQTAIQSLQQGFYVSCVLSLYRDMPDTPDRGNGQDLRHAQRLQAAEVPLEIVETALVLASVRRRMRPAEAPPLPRVRSLAYFQPVIDELLQHPPGAGYLHYLRRKLAALRVPQSPAASASTSMDRSPQAQHEVQP